MPRIPSPPATPDHASLQQAAEWYAALLADDADDAERARWRQWLAQSPLHARAWAQIEAVGRHFEPLRGNGLREAADAGLKAARRAGRRRALSGLLSLGALGLLGWAGWRYPPLQRELRAWNADYRTGIGEIRELGLADGSRIWLASDSALDVDYAPGLRHLRLVAGEIHVRTAPDAGRAFLVETAHGRMRALGTRFNVRLEPRETELAVYEGAVEVRIATGAQTVEAGRQVRFDAAGIVQPRAAGTAGEAWTRGVLLADQMPLQALVAELARYRHGHLGVSPDVAGLPVMGVYPLQDSDTALSLLEQGLPVRVRRTLPWWVTVERAPSMAVSPSGP